VPKEGKVLERLCRTRSRHLPFLPAFLRPRALPLGSLRDLGHWMAGSREDGVHAGGCFRCGGHHFARECTLPKKYPHAFLPAPTTALGNAGRWAGAIIVMGRTTHPATAPKRCAISPRSRAQLWSLSSRYFRNMLRLSRALPLMQTSSTRSLALVHRTGNDMRSMWRAGSRRDTVSTAPAQAADRARYEV
jgi:hypothetical protein